MKTKREFFGTDGIRGRVGEGHLTPEFILELGRAAGTVFGNKADILIARDPRVSSQMLQAALSSGITSMGANVCDVGVMPTPACAYLTKYLEAAAGVVISASHNPYYDNGLKFFSDTGNKLTDQQEVCIENVLLTNRENNYHISPNKIGHIKIDESLLNHYVNYCLSVFTQAQSQRPPLENINDLKVIVDCSNGATYKVGPEVLQATGAKVFVMNSEPSGLNINQECGAANQEGLELLAKKVKSQKADLGIAFDGDGDRVILVSSKGHIIDGDQILYILANYKLRTEQPITGVVGTQMSNYGLELAMKERGLAFERAKVGDRYVLEKLNERGWTLGGETSGHILDLDLATTGDGLITCLMILSIMSQEGKTLDELVQGFNKYPQVMINVNLLDADLDVLGVPTVQDAIDELEHQLNSKGRLLVRKSGTEPLLRVMVEGENRRDITKMAEQLSEVIRAEIK